MFYKHDWVVKSEYKFENELKNFIGHGVSFDGLTARNLAQRGIITVVQCSKCNKVKHIKTVF